MEGNAEESIHETVTDALDLAIDQEAIFQKWQPDDYIEMIRQNRKVFEASYTGVGRGLGDRGLIIGRVTSNARVIGTPFEFDGATLNRGILVPTSNRPIQPLEVTRDVENVLAEVVTKTLSVINGVDKISGVSGINNGYMDSGSDDGYSGVDNI
ncbi:hypothetical protein Tco_0906395 [Tanacetum coccineum]|uniref:Uncharacterized protein n=1 Tax=Tanacetum coccineum TaxID=301880 RepID=A0ABQ5CGQ4_9ASTR